MTSPANFPAAPASDAAACAACPRFMRRPTRREYVWGRGQGLVLVAVVVTRLGEGVRHRRFVEAAEVSGGRN